LNQFRLNLNSKKLFSNLQSTELWITLLLPRAAFRGYRLHLGYWRSQSSWRRISFSPHNYPRQSICQIQCSFGLPSSLTSEM